MQLIFNKFNKNFFYISLVFFLTIFTNEVFYLFYDMQESPDFSKYKIYLEHFFNNEPTNKEQGLLYYYINAYYLNIFYSGVSVENIYIHKSIMEVNLIIFLVGLLGYFKLSKQLGFKNKSILFLFILLIFFPPSLTLRLIFKPEILAFALLPWIIYLINQYKHSTNFKYILFCIPLLISALTLKGNITVLISAYLLLSEFKTLLQLGIKKIVLVLILFGTLGTLILFENNQSNGNSLFDTQSGSVTEENYDFKAPKSIIYKTNLYKLFSSPIKNNFANSFIGITLLETNGDYFDLYWDNDASILFKNRKNILITEQSNEIKLPEVNFSDLSVKIFQQRQTDIYIRESIGFLLSILFFFLLFYSIKKYKLHRMYLFAGFLGMILMALHAITGFPINNFDPEVGDTFKPIYYSFLYLLSFSLVVLNLSEKGLLKFIHIFLYIFLILFIFGLPLENGYSQDSYFQEKLTASNLCSLDVRIVNVEEGFSCSKNNSSTSNSVFFKEKIIHKPFNLFLIFTNFLVLIYVLNEKRFDKLLKNFFLIKNKQKN